MLKPIFSHVPVPLFTSAALKPALPEDWRYNLLMPLDPVARRYAHALYVDKLEELTRKHAARTAELRAGLAQRGMFPHTAGHYHSEMTRIGVEHIGEIANARVDSFLAAYARAKLPIDDQAVGDIVREATQFCEAQAKNLIANTQEQVGRAGMPPGVGDQLAESHTYPEFFSLIERPELARFAIQNYFCAQNLLTLFFLENQHIDRNTDEYPLSRAIVGLFGGVIEAILASRLTVGSKTTLRGFINEGRETGLIRVGTKLAALCTLILYLRNHVHAERAASQTEFFIDINVAKGCKVALDWAISELLEQSAAPNTVAGPRGPAAHPEPVGPHGATGPGPPPSSTDKEAK